MSFAFSNHRRNSLTTLGCVLLSCLWAMLSLGQGQDAAAQPIAPETLVPAALGIRTDQKGNSWNVEPNGTIGRIGSTMVNSGLALSIDDEKFVSFQPLMTPDGDEFVLQGRELAETPGLQVQRRIRLLEKPGALRYAEMFYNGSTDVITVSVALTTNFSGNYKTFLTDRGRTEPVLLEEAESGIVVLPGATQSTRAFLFTLADIESEVKPTISAQNRYGLTIRYPLRLAPGQTGVILHHVAQVVIPQNFDRRNLKKLFRPFSFAETSGEVPSDWRDFLLNAGESSRNPAAAILRKRGLDSLGIEQGPRDILAIGPKTRLAGEVRGGDLALTGSYGEATIPWEKVAALSGSNGENGRLPTVYFRDGQIISASVSVPDFAFVQTGGGKIDLSVESLDRLVRARSDADANWASGVLGMIETFDGDRLKIQDASSLSLFGITPWGRLPISLGELIWLGPATEGQSGHWVELVNGLRCLVYFNGESVSLKNEQFGDIDLSMNELKSVFTPRIQERNHWNTAIGIRTSVRVRGNQLLIGDIGNTTLPVISQGTKIETASSDVRRVERIRDVSASAGGLPEDTPSFEVELWDGGILTGIIDLNVLSLKVDGQTWRVPIRDIERIDTPSPELTPDALATIKQLIENLGSDDWNTREKATRELGAFGYLARPVLKQELQSSTDPEVSHRLQRILADLN